MTQRLLLSWSRPLLPQAARLLVEHYATEPRHASHGAEARMDGAVVVLPGSRAGRRLKELLVEVAEEQGVRLIPPEVVTQGVLPELLHEPDGPLASGTVLRLMWAEALRDAAATPAGREHLSRIFAALPAGAGAGSGGGTLGDWTPLARELSQLARTVAAGGYRFRDVAERCGGSLLFDDAPRWRTLARVQDRVEARLAELGFRDRDLSRLHALDRGAVRLPGDVWLVGVAEMTGVLRRMLAEARDGTLRALVHGPGDPGAEALFDEMGCVRGEAWSAQEPPVPDEAIRMVDRPAHQAEAVAEILAGLRGGYAPDDIAIGVPSSEVVPALEQRLPKSGVAVRDAAGTPLSASGPFRLLRGVADFLADRRWEAFAALVRHPDLAPALEVAEGGEGLPADWLTCLDRWYGEHIPATVPETFRDQRSREGAATRTVVERLDRILAGFAPPPGPRGGAASVPLSRWVEPILRFLASVYAPHRLSDEREGDRLVLRALGELRWAAESLARIPAPVDTPSDAHTALRLLLEEGASVRLPSPARDDAVEMLGWLELHLDDAPVTIVTGVNEGALPESVRGDPFLPDALRRLLGLEDNRQRHARDVYRLAAMAHSREVLHLVSGRRTPDGDPLRPSRLLFAAADETVARRVRRFYGEEEAEKGGVVAPEKSDAPERGAEAPQPPGALGGFRLPPEEEIPLEPFPGTIYVTDFRGLMADPYEWALGRVRDLRVLDDGALEMDGALFGTLAHQVLQDFGSDEGLRHGRGEVLTDPLRLWEELEDHLERHVGGRFGPGASRARVAVRLQVEQLRSRLRAFAHWHAEWVARGWRVRAVELGPPRGEGIPFAFQEGRSPVGLRARIDRVDHNPETGEWAVFDYKTSDAGDDPEKVHRKGRKEKEWQDLQLPLYHWLVTRIPGRDGAPVVPPDPEPLIRLGYILLPRDLEKVGHAMAPWDAQEVAGGVERARELLRDLARGPVRFDPAYRPRYPDEQVEALVGRSVLVTGDDPEEDA